ncbi:1-acyl-sn-glycerol-3-phosphate acyltransferase [Quadrisphaera sp. DSM 44207]|uniref:lysophospholipid acyltransferase family protein n=1 Tax=Quadrisphaera sp. DSM 44207 TaxID=1881057 RepID=UPI00088B0CF6|nr:lysophospholipid acyltransferase family protein [Quadrisphaera sp. DSM 44207]SDQ33441.1 1-acyl-sn-glycerol-3-phosphate acyltransferase [Quadrisphaera sp. DSM 44207]
MFYWLAKAVLYPLMTALFRPWVRGLENVPAAGPAILVANHRSFSDSVFLPLVVPRRVTFLAKSDYFTGRGVKGRLTAGFFKGVGQLPIDRSGGKASEAAIRTGLGVLARGELLGLYPEGTRSPDGRLYRGRTGVARMALTAGVPVIPVALFGTDVVQPVGRTIPRIRRVGVVIGRPLDFSRYAGMENDRFVLRSVTDEIMYEIMRLSGQEYVDLYATTMKERLSAASVKDRLAAATRGAVGGEEGVARARAAAQAAADSAPGGRPAPEQEPVADDGAALDGSGGGSANGSVSGSGDASADGMLDDALDAVVEDERGGRRGEPR